jgi:RNA polymerase sigma-70 factor (ECF subfamily)
MAVPLGQNRPPRISREPPPIRPTQRAPRRPVDPAATRGGGPAKMAFVASRALQELYADDAALVAALRGGDGRARILLVERFEPLVERLVAGALGIDAETPDVVQDVFVAVLEGIHNLKEASALRGWIATLAVFTARGRIRRRRRWRWIRFVAPEEVPEVPVAGPQGETHEAVRATYAILESFPADERLAFSLRFISEMQLTEVAEACRVSLATVKRRLARAEKRFVEAARRHPALHERLTRSDRWGAEEP